MNATLQKLESTAISAPGGALIGAAGGYLLAKYFGYDKTITVVSFTLVGAIIVASLTYKYKNKS